MSPLATDPSSIVAEQIAMNNSGISPYTTGLTNNPFWGVNPIWNQRIGIPSMLPTVNPYFVNQLGFSQSPWNTPYHLNSFNAWSNPYIQSQLIGNPFNRFNQGHWNPQAQIFNQNAGYPYAPTFGNVPAYPHFGSFIPQSFVPFSTYNPFVGNVRI